VVEPDRHRDDAVAELNALMRHARPIMGTRKPKRREARVFWRGHRPRPPDSNQVLTFVP
jgi:hypothetical protein